MASKVLQEVIVNKAQGPDEFHPRLVVECQSQFKKILTYIFIKSLCKGKLPYQWKQANVTPIFKSGEKRLR